jgi:glucoamylase
VVIEDNRPFVLHYGRDGWSDTADRFSIRLRSGSHGVRLDAVDLMAAHVLNFTRFYPEDDHWEGVDHVVAVLNGGQHGHPGN